MKTENELMQGFAPYSITLGAETFLPYPKALDFVNECFKNDLAIVGIEGFTRKPDDGLIAHQDMIADFSDARKKIPNWMERLDFCRNASLEFFKTLESEGKLLEKYIFNFVVMSKQEWEKLGEDVDRRQQ